MGLPTTLSMLLGCIIGWGILSPIAKFNGWAPGDVDDWTSGSSGWLIWISLAIMLSDCLVSLGVLIFRSAVQMYKTTTYKRLHEGNVNAEQEEAPDQFLIHNKEVVIGLSASCLLCVVCVRLVFGNIVPIYALIIAIILALFLSLLGVRALGRLEVSNSR